MFAKEQSWPSVLINWGTNSKCNNGIFRRELLLKQYIGLTYPNSLCKEPVLRFIGHSNMKPTISVWLIITKEISLSTSSFWATIWLKKCPGGPASHVEVIYRAVFVWALIQPHFSAWPHFAAWAMPNAYWITWKKKVCGGGGTSLLLYDILE